MTSACDDELKEKLNGEISVMPLEFRSGPTAFMIIARNIVATTEKTIRAFTYHLQRLKLNTIPGEDVGKFASIFKGAANRLRAAGHLPKDVRTLAYEGLRTGTNFQFRQILEVKWIIQSPEMQTWDSILDTAQKAYQELLAENNWVTRKKQGSTFSAANPATPQQGNGNNKGKGSNGRNTGKTPAVVDRTPPKPGEPHTRIVNGKEEYWCANCRGGGRWGNHPTSGHEKWYADFQKHVKDKKAKKTTGASGTPPSSSTNNVQQLRPAAMPVSTPFSNFQRRSFD